MAVFVGLCALILAIAVALDKALKEDFRLKIASSLARIGQSPSPAIGLEKWLDKKAGVRLLSLRAFWFSLRLSLFSILIMAIAAAILDPTFFLKYIVDAFIPTTKTQFVIWSVFLVFVIFADFLSLAQTRLFIRATNKFRENGVAGVMLIADALSSFFIFVVITTIARLISYFYVGFFLMNSHIDNEYKISPYAISKSIDALGITPNNISDKTIKRDFFVFSEFDKSGNLSILNEYIKYDDNVSSEYNSALSYKPLKSCVSYSNDTAITNVEAYSVVTHNLSFVFRIAEGADIDIKKEKNRIEKLVAFHTLRAPGSNASCQIPVVAIDKSLDVQRVLRSIPLSDLYLAALTPNVNDTISSVPRKFAEYNVVDPIKDFSYFLQYAFLADATSLFGAGGIDEGKSNALTLVQTLDWTESTPRTTAGVPFTTYAASALTPTLLFVFSLILRTFSLIWIRVREILKDRLSGVMDGQYILTGLIALLVLCVWTVMVVVAVVGAIWRA